MRIAVAGSGRLAAGALARLLDSPHEIVAVVESGRRSGIGRKADALLSAALSPGATPGGMALRRGIPIVYLDRMDAEELAPLAQTEPATPPCCRATADRTRSRRLSSPASRRAA